MARIRTIKPEFWTSEQVVNCSRDARLLFIGMWNFCDDGGVHPDSTKRLMMEIFPADNLTVEMMVKMVDELVAAELVTRFKANGERYLHVTGWQKHQRIQKPNYRYPSPPIGCENSDTSLRPVNDQSANGPLPVSDQSTPEWNRRGKEEEEGSEAKASGATAPPMNRVEVRIEVDPEAVIFGSCREYLVANGVKDRHARSKLGEWRKEYGDGAVIDAVADAQRRAVSEPIAWLTKTLQARSQVRASGGRPDDGCL